MKPKYLILIIIVPVIVAAGAYLTIRLIKNAENRLIEETKEKLSIEKEVFVDESRNLNITFLIWKEDEEFNTELIKIELIKPDGTVIDKEMAAEKPNIQWSVFPVKSWGVDENVKVSIYVSRPELGIWKIRATPTNNKNLPKFRVSSVGSGTTAIVFYLKSGKNSYLNLEEPLINGSLSGPVKVKGAEIFGKVVHPDGRKTDFKLYDDGLKEHGDDYLNDGRYYNYFTDFSESGFYKFEMTAKNINGMTVEPGDSPYISLPPPGVPLPQSKPVPPFTREKTLTIEISDSPEHIRDKIKKRDETRKSDLKQIQAAIELYYDKYGSYPQTWGRVCKTDYGYLLSLATILKEAGLMDVVPCDPLIEIGHDWVDYDYEGPSSNRQEYYLLAKLENPSAEDIATLTNCPGKSGYLQGVNYKLCND